jgi:hypothetical protein
VSRSERSIVLFDLAGTLGAELTSSEGQRLHRFLPFPRVVELLRELKREAELGVLTYDAQLSTDEISVAVRKDPTLRDLIEGDLILHGGRGLPSDLLDGKRDITFVGLHAAHRVQALEAGLRVAPHPALVQAQLGGDELLYVRAEARGAGPAFRFCTS